MGIDNELALTTIAFYKLKQNKEAISSLLVLAPSFFG
jgi:hypothetical protein